MNSRQNTLKYVALRCWVAQEGFLPCAVDNPSSLCHPQHSSPSKHCDDEIRGLNPKAQNQAAAGAAATAGVQLYTEAAMQDDCSPVNYLISKRHDSCHT